MGRFLEGVDWVGVTLLIILSSFGLFLLLSIRQQLFTQQLFFLVIGLCIAYGVSRIDGVALRYFSNYFYLGALALLILTYLSPDIRGAARWIHIGPIQIQPSEIVKPFLLLFFANFMANFSPRKLRYFPYHFVLFIVPFLLVFKQPDLGSAIVYMSFWFTMLFAGGLSFSFIFIIGVFAAFVAPFLWHILAPFQKMRLVTFFNPSFDPQGAGYNAFQAMITVGSGQLLGRGLGKGTQSHLKFLPEFHTDFIFATLIEELGFVGGLLLFILYGVFLWRLIRPFFRGQSFDNVVFFYTLGLFGMILTQIIVNAGMNMGIIPITGITLPLISYGGSSLLSICVSFGFLWALERSGKNRSIAIES